MPARRHIASIAATTASTNAWSSSGITSTPYVSRTRNHRFEAVATGAPFRVISYFVVDDVPLYVKRRSASDRDLEAVPHRGDEGLLDGSDPLAVSLDHHRLFQPQLPLPGYGRAGVPDRSRIWIVLRTLGAFRRH